MDYYEVGGSFVNFLDAQGFENLWPGQSWWDTALNGTLWQRLAYQRWAQGLWHGTWDVGGDFTAYFLAQQPNPHEIVVFTHSHGFQVLQYALSKDNCPAIGAACVVAGPVRADMVQVYAKARPKMGKLMYVATGSRDKWKWLGTIGTGSVLDTLGSIAGVTLGPTDADRTEKLLELDHTELYKDQARYHLWGEAGRLDFMRVAPTD